MLEKTDDKRSGEGHGVRGVPDVVGTNAPAMPVRRAPRIPRVQLNTRVRHDIDQLLVRFVAEQSATVQETVDMALTEFLAARGYHLEGVS